MSHSAAPKERWAAASEAHAPLCALKASDPYHHLTRHELEEPLAVTQTLLVNALADRAELDSNPAKRVLTALERGTLAS